MALQSKKRLEALKRIPDTVRQADAHPPHYREAVHSPVRCAAESHLFGAVSYIAVICELIGLLLDSEEGRSHKTFRRCVRPANPMTALCVLFLVFPCSSCLLSVWTVRSECSCKTSATAHAAVSSGRPHA